MRRRASSPVARYSTRRVQSNSVGFGDVAIAMGYGAARGWIASLVRPFTQMIPLGNLADNLAIGGIMWLANKSNVGGSLGKSLTRTAVLGEAMMAGAELTAGTATSGSSNNLMQFPI